MVKIFVGNIAEGVTDADLRQLFEKYSKVTECDVLGSYGFVHLPTDLDAETAIVNLDKTFLKGQAINVERSKSITGARKPGSVVGGVRAVAGQTGGYNPQDGSFNSKLVRRAGCTKLHIANVAEGVSSIELRELFERYGFVAECDIVEDRRIAFVHIEDAASEAAIQGLNGFVYKGNILKVQMSKNQNKPMVQATPSLYAATRFSQQPTSYGMSMAHLSPATLAMLPHLQSQGVVPQLGSAGMPGLPMTAYAYPATATQLNNPHIPK